LPPDERVKKELSAILKSPTMGLSMTAPPFQNYGTLKVFEDLRLARLYRRAEIRLAIPNASPRTCKPPEQDHHTIPIDNLANQTQSRDII